MYQIRYNDTGLNEAAKAMWAGNLRYPGGTVANYWYMNNATFVNPCKGYHPVHDDDDDHSTDDSASTERMCENEYTNVSLGDKSWNYYTYSCRNNMDGEY